LEPEGSIELITLTIFQVGRGQFRLTYGWAALLGPVGVLVTQALIATTKHPWLPTSWLCGLSLLVAGCFLAAVYLFKRSEPSITRDALGGAFFQGFGTFLLRLMRSLYPLGQIPGADGIPDAVLGGLFTGTIVFIFMRWMLERREKQKSSPSS
jgi:hypothetical protein